MTKVNKIIEFYAMRPHTAEKVNDLLDKHLPKRQYASTIRKRLVESQGLDIDELAIRHVRNCVTHNPLVFTEIIKYAREMREVSKNLKKTAATV